MIKKILKTGLCAMLALSFTTSNIFAADFNWSKMFNSDKPFTQEQNKIAEKISVGLNAESADDGITLRARMLIGDRFTATIAVDVISNNGRKLPKADSLTFLNMSAIDLGLGEYRPQGAIIVDKDCDINFSDPGNKDLYFTGGYVQGSVNLIFRRGDDISDYEKTLYFSCTGLGGEYTNGYPQSLLLGKKAVFNLSKLYVMHPNLNLAANSGYDIISDGKWHFEVPLDYPTDITKEYTINKSYTKKIGSKDRKVTIKKAIVTPLQIYVDGTVEKEEWERLPISIRPMVKLTNGHILAGDERYQFDFYSAFMEPLDLGDDGKMVQSIILDGHEFKVK